MDGFFGFQLHGITTDLQNEEEDEYDGGDLCDGVDLDLMIDENNTTDLLGINNSHEVNSRYCKKDLFMDKNLSVIESNSHVDTTNNNNNNVLEVVFYSIKYINHSNFKTVNKNNLITCFILGSIMWAARLLGFSIN